MKRESPLSNQVRHIQHYLLICSKCKVRFRGEGAGVSIDFEQLESSYQPEKHHQDETGDSDQHRIFYGLSCASKFCRCEGENAECDYSKRQSDFYANGQGF
ncbi:MAG: hypothetical protein LBO09_03375 [Candidatus Peribacteria bacterium]|nr:hypothetical protein [Candidatus Peribacteria bacterium]